MIPGTLDRLFAEFVGTLLGPEGAVKPSGPSDVVIDIARGPAWSDASAYRTVATRRGTR